MAGHKWFQLFLKHHEELCVKHGATNLSLSRALGSTKEIVENWFDKYEALVESIGTIDPACIWNIDRHGSENMHKVKKVVGIKGVKQFQIQPREKARHTTMLTYLKGWLCPSYIVGTTMTLVALMHQSKSLLGGPKKATSTRNCL